MEREVIERLAMDAELGELNEDTRLLLDAYLARCPEEKQWAEEMAAFCRRTQEAVSTRAEQPAAVPVVARHPRPSLPWGTVARWAAVVFVSAAIGAGLGRPFKSHPAPSGPGIAVDTVRTAASRNRQDIVTGSAGGFWQTKAATMLQPRPQRAAASQPDLWETLKQLQKGRSYELSRQ
jgi:hypothetical protein